MIMKDVLVVHNSASGNHKTPYLKKVLDRYFSAPEFNYKLYEVTGGELIEDVVRDHVKRGYDLIVAAGGDGTISAVAGGLVGERAPLGIIPVGTGNMIARELRIPLNIKRSAEVISSRHTIKTIDAMRLGNRTFILTIGVGISSLAVRDLTRKDKSRFGLLAYVGSALKHIVKFKPHDFTLTVDGERMKIRSPEVSVSNGGIISDMILPKGLGIRIDDGAVDVCYVKANSVKDYPALMLNVLGRKPTGSRICCLKARKKITIDAEKKITVQADGEVTGETPITVEVIPSAFRVIVPENAGNHRG
ncbi:MAG: diacylglycerol kinase family protein [Candidatus Krumholzibacteriota bacterium]|nr:diacylglycerol kinase family protein [Candidatus Krumholzibacteriota bacterium]